MNILKSIIELKVSRQSVRFRHFRNSVARLWLLLLGVGIFGLSPAQAKPHTLTISWKHPKASQTNIHRTVGDDAEWQFKVDFAADVVVVEGPTWSHTPEGDGVDASWGLWTTDDSGHYLWSGANNQGAFSVKVKGKIKHVTQGGTTGTAQPPEIEDFEADWSGDVVVPKIWDTGDGIAGGELMGGEDSIIVHSNRILSLSVSPPTDTDHYTAGTDSGTEDDKVNTTWFVSGPVSMSWKGTDFHWITPPLAGDYTITCFMDDEAIVPPTDTGERHDGPKTQTVTVKVVGGVECEDPDGCGPVNPDPPCTGDDCGGGCTGDGRIWSTDSSLSSAGIGGPAELKPGQSAQYSISASDMDLYTRADGTGPRSVADGLTYRWSWSDASGHGSSESDSVTFTAPQQEGIYLLSCTVDDVGTHDCPDTGSRDDAALVASIYIHVASGNSTLSKIWSAYPAISVSGISGPTKVVPNSTVAFSVTASDVDNWSTSDGHFGSENDTVHYHWSVNGVAAGTDSPSLGWTAPGTGGTFAVACSITDDGPAPVAPDTGSRKDSDASSSITIQVTTNNAPVAEGGTVSTIVDTPVGVPLNAHDPDGDSITITYTQPQNGSFDGSQYTPNSGFYGTDAFTFKANDSISDSNVATMTITVDAPPVAESQTVSTAKDTPVDITLSATDADGDTLTYSLVTNPQHGTISGTLPVITYTPTTGSHGSDVFTFKANDGKVDSNTANIEVDVASGGTNHPPVTVGQDATINEDTPTTIALTATDEDDDTLTYSYTQPSHGSLSGTVPALIYTPEANFNGFDSFDFTANDGTANSNTSTLSITVAPVNDEPVANAGGTTTDENIPVAIGLSASDIDGDTLTYAYSAPAHGSLSGTAPDLTYTPNANFNGADSFTFTANDGTVNSATVSIGITVYPVNNPPIAADLAVETPQNTPVATTLSATDADGDALTYTYTAPANGTLTGTAPDLTYTPNAGSHGSDWFSYKANDGKADSNAATVTVAVIKDGGNTPPVATNQTVTTAEDTPTTIVLVGTDADGDALSYSYAQPAHGTVSGIGATVVYSPAKDFNGSDAFTFTVNDGTASSDPATVNITVTPVNDAPIAVEQVATTDEDTAVTIALGATDVDGDALTYTYTQPENGTLSGTAPNVTYTPDADYNGADSFTFRASDGNLESDEAAVSIDVTPVNDAPVAVAQSATVNENAATPITLAATDVDGDTLTYSVGAAAHGTVTVDGNVATYTPTENYLGDDAFTFMANDDKVNSAPATVSITVVSAKVWTVGHAIGTVVTPTGTTHNGRMTAPQDQTVDGYSTDPIPVDPNTLVGCTVEAATDDDHWVEGADAGDEADTIKDPDDYVWTGGTFVTATVTHEGGPDTYTTATSVVGRTATLLTPASGSVVVSCSISNGNAKLIVAPDSGNREDPALGCSVKLTVGPDYNLPPIAIVDAYGTAQNTVLNGSSVLTNDLDDDSNPLTATMLADPAHGSAHVNADGSFVYTPEKDYVGEDSFRYTANDSHGGIASATVELTVAPATSATEGNHPPIAVVDAGFTYENRLLHGASVLPNDSDQDGDSLTAGSPTTPGHGTVTMNYLGDYIYTPATDYIGEDIFTYTDSDGNSGTATATTIVSVIRPDGDDFYQTPTGTPLVMAAPGVLASDPKAASETLTATGATTPAHGTVTLNLDGSFTYTPAAGFEGEDGFNYTSTRIGSDVATTKHVQILIGDDIKLTYTSGLVGGLLRACAGGIDDHDGRNSAGVLDVQYQAHTRLVTATLTKNGTNMAGKTVNLTFTGHTGHDYADGRTSLSARLHAAGTGHFDSTTWLENLAVTSDANGVVQFWVRSGDVVSNPVLQATYTDEDGSILKIGEVKCDFADDQNLRGFADVYHPNEPDSGWLFRQEWLTSPTDRTTCKVYLKFAVDPTLGDVDGNWQYVNGHRILVGVDHVDSSPTITPFTQTTSYGSVIPRSSDHTSTTTRDGAATVTIVAGEDINSISKIYFSAFDQNQWDN